MTTEKIAITKDREVKTIFWASLQISQGEVTHSIERFYETKTKGDFFNWLEARSFIEDVGFRRVITILNCGMI
jgi:hypothetical protein